MLTRFALMLFATCMCALVQGQDIFESGLLHIRIEIPYENWHDTLTSLKQRNSKDGLRGEVHIEGQTYQEVEVRFKGNSSFHGALKTNLRKLPLRLKAAKGERFEGGYKTLKLSNNYRDPSYVRELLAYRVISTYMHVPKTLPAVVTVNGEYLGVYTVTEGIEKAMIKRVFNDDKGILYQCEPDFSGHTPPHCQKSSFSSLQYLGDNTDCYRHLYEVDEESDWKYLIDLMRRLQRPAQVSEVLDVHAVLWMHALNNVLVNLDSYIGIFCHNYYLFRDSTGTFHPLMWDMNLAFGGFHALKSGVSVDLVHLSPIVHDKYDLTNRPLLYQLLQEEENRHLYYSFIRTIVEDWFLSEAYLDKARTLQELIDPWVRQEKDAQYTYEEFQVSLMQTVKKGDNRSVLGIGELMSQRTDYLMRHPLLARVDTTENDCHLYQPGTKDAVRLHASPAATKVALFYKTQDKANYTRVPMFHQGVDAQGRSMWSADAPDAEHFYFVVRKKESAYLFPRAAPLRAFSVSSADM